MKKRARVALLTLLVIVVGAVIWAIVEPRVPDPMYKGKALSKWMKEAAYASYMFLDSSANSGNFDELKVKVDSWVAAVRESGTNATPLLLNAIRASDSDLKFKFYRLIEKQHLIKVKHVPAEMLNQAAQVGFEILASNASNAVPELIRIYKSDPEGLTSGYAAESLAVIGPVDNNAVLALANGTTNKNYVVRRRAVSALNRMHPDPKIVVPVLTECLKDADRIVRRWAADALGHYGKSAASALPELRKLASDTDSSVRDSASKALKLIEGDDGSSTIPACSH